MRKILMLLLLSATVLSLPTKAQDTGRWEVFTGLSFSEYDRFPVVWKSSNSVIFASEETVTFAGENGTVKYMSRPIVLPTVSLTVGYKFPDSVLGLYLSGYWNYAWNCLNGGPAPLIERESILHIIPEARIYYMDKPSVKLYGTFGGGIRLHRYSETLEGDKVISDDSRFSFTLSPCGVCFGEHWLFTANIGFGMAWSSVLVGAGYRF